ncbi:unnamed protein product [Vitrella brassicaformis CCMP3155]|uniref:Clathrin light chain n=2 Tax=Vitrella brassicaformis TaxID=1169539 RepID=A0A0G4EGU4_VITBC|nr:unnamed protein product [Vitrella brassicaformis CCMP3155]|mmetsp:Transcript_28892/g.72032  ORF Transcript_28892/g.72032 Transcript_28892/m.72032 type:complete len:225 (+) Transcript_28892:33-707(+)|eukprot:CEL95467.1 unnamed protein product [Vitrella brassicaformis CCMP3155]
MDPSEDFLKSENGFGDSSQMQGDFGSPSQYDTFDFAASTAPPAQPPADSAAATTGGMRAFDMPADNGYAPPAPAAVPLDMGGGGAGGAAGGGASDGVIEGGGMGGGPAYIPEVNPLTEWEEKHNAELDDKNRQEDEAKKQARAKAQEDIKKWYEEYKLSVAKRKEQNQLEEKEAMAARETDLTRDNAWERVCTMVDLNKESQRDTSRMKQTFIQLKNNPLPSAS